MPLNNIYMVISTPRLYLMSFSPKYQVHIPHCPSTLSAWISNKFQFKMYQIDNLVSPGPQNFSTCELFHLSWWHLPLTGCSAPKPPFVPYSAYILVLHSEVSASWHQLHCCCPSGETTWRGHMGEGDPKTTWIGRYPGVLGVPSVSTAISPSKTHPLSPVRWQNHERQYIVVLSHWVFLPRDFQSWPLLYKFQTCRGRANIPLCLEPSLPLRSFCFLLQTVPGLGEGS